MIGFEKWSLVAQSLEIDGLRHSYIDVQDPSDGKKPAILLLHGFPTWGYDWVDIIGVLSVTHRVVVPDWIGYGLSDKPNRHVPVPEQIDRLRILLDQLDVGDFHLVAHDYGATCAQEILSRPDLASRVKSLMLMNGGVIQSAYRPTRTQKLMLTPLGAFVTRLLSKTKLRKKLDALRGRKYTDAQFEALWQGVVHNDGLRKSHILQRYILERRENHEKWEAALAAFPGPALLIWGPVDPISGAHVLAPLRNLMPDATVLELDGIGHFVPDEAPERVGPAIADFIQKATENA